MNACEQINQTSGIVEYYTPPFIVEAARAVLGGSIDLDPFSSLAANERVKANRIFTQDDDGFAQSWKCDTLWANHPFGRAYNKRFVERMELAWSSGIIHHSALCITYACTSEAWFQPLAQRPQCYLSPRTNYLLPDGTVFKGVPKGSVVTYFGGNLDLFAEHFGKLGTVKIAYKHP